MKKLIKNSLSNKFNGKGLGLVEVLVTIAVIAILVVFALNALFSAQQLRVLSMQKSIAVLHAKSTLDQIQYQASTIGRAAFSNQKYGSQDGVTVNNLLGFIGVSEGLDNESIHICFPSRIQISTGNAHVRIRVTWDFRGRHHEVTIEGNILLAK